jgi:hypothetical protein
MLRSGNEERIITEALAVSNQVVTLLPTYGPWTRVATWHSNSAPDIHGMTSIMITSDGIVNSDGNIIARNKAELVRNTTKWVGPVALVINVDLPVKLSTLIDSADVLSYYVGKHGMHFNIIRR